MNPKGPTVNILEIGERRIALLRARKSPNGIETVECVSIQGQWSASDGSLDAALKQFAADHDMRRDPLYTVIPRYDMTARLLTLPSLDPEEVAGMVRLGAEEHVPYALDDLVVGQTILNRLPDGESSVLAVFSHRDVLENHVALLKSAGLVPDEIFVSTACLATAVIAAQRLTDEVSALVHLASGGFEVLVFNGTRLEYARGVASGADWDFDGDAAPALVEELATELRSSLAAHRRMSQTGAGVDRIFLSLEGGAPATACRLIEEAVGHVCLPQPYARAITGQDGHDLSLAAVGAALAAHGRAPATLRLEAPSLARARDRARTRRAVFKLAALAIALAGAAALLYAHAIVSRQAYLDEISSRLDEVLPVARTVELKERQLIALQRQVDAGGTAIELLAAITNAAPDEGLNIYRFTFSRGLGITLEGRQDDRFKANKFASSLRELAAEGNVHLSRSQTKGVIEEQEQGKQVWKFQIEAPFESPDETQIETLEDE